MSLLEWRDAYRIGIAEVDHEHQQLIGHINTLLEISLGGSKTAVADALGELHAQITAHFALEEKLMSAQRYPGYAAHKEDHEELLESLRDIMDAQERGRGYSAPQLADALSSWFMNHFREHDARWHKSLGAAK